MNKTNVLIIVGVVVLVIGAGIYFTISKAPSVIAPTIQEINTPVTSETSTAIQTPVTNVTINIKNFAFNPSTITIKAGTKVTWINNDFVSHTITSDSGNLLNSQPVLSGQSFSFTFTNSGTINYYCSIHPTMKGSVIVE